MPLTPLRVAGDRFVDSHGREVMLRGVNLGGDCKLPFLNGETWRNDDFSGHREVSFAGRPFPLEEAADHFSRLREWGFNCLRLLTTWEAVEHAGRGIYDTEYLDYYAEICRLACEYGMYVFVDFHQDVWSRMTGGSGAPGWTLELIGLDIAKLEPAGAALTMQRSFDAGDLNPHQPSYPQMCWSSNYTLPANGIMWSLFFSGKTVVPDFMVEGEHVQDILRSAYLGCLAQVASRVAHLPNVIGFDSLNEPSVGWLDRALSEEAVRFRRPGAGISPLAGLAAADGISIEVPLYGIGETVASAKKVLNPNGIRIWRDDVTCPFQAAGIYRIEGNAPVALDEDAFRRGRDGGPLDVANDVYGTFFADVAQTVRAFNPEWLLFAEIEPMGPFRGHHFPSAMPAGSVNASHWYDLPTLYFKHLNVDNYINPLTGTTASGEKGVTEVFRAGMAPRKAASEVFGPAPSLIGEFGIPFDLSHGMGYRLWREGDRAAAFVPHEQALGMMYDALDALKLNATIWNYTASNRNDLRIGDGWNQEDLSIFSIDQADGPDKGARALKGFARPYVRAAQGRIEAVSFDRAAGVFRAELDIDPDVTQPTEIVLPAAHFPNGGKAVCDGIEAVVESYAGVLSVRGREGGRLTVTVSA